MLQLDLNTNMEQRLIQIAYDNGYKEFIYYVRKYNKHQQF